MTSRPKIYFAGAIRGGRDDAGLYAQIVELLKSYGEVLTEHVGNAELTSSGETADDDAIYKRDMEWLAESDALVAEVTIPSLGVGYEIGKMTEWERPVLCLFRPSKGRVLSAMIAASANVTVRTYESLSELPAILADFFGD